MMISGGRVAQVRGDPERLADREERRRRHDDVDAVGQQGSTPKVSRCWPVSLSMPTRPIGQADEQDWMAAHGRAAEDADTAKKAST
jgi:hypothetical protein